MGKKPKYNVKSKTKSELKWDDLVPLYKDTSISLQGAISALHEVGVAFKDIIDHDAEIAEIHVGVANSFADLTKELNKLLNTHSRVIKNDETGNNEYRPFTGKVSDTDEKQQEVYLYVVMAYGGINDKIVSVTENVTVTLLGKIKEATVDLEAQVVAKEKEIADGK